MIIDIQKRIVIVFSQNYMEKLMKYLLNEIIECLTLSDFFKLKQLSKTIKSKLDSTQHLVLKREAFNTFCPHLFS